MSIRIRTALQGDALKLKERFFTSGSELLRPVNMMISDSYPLAERETNVIKNDEFERAKNRARALLYEQRNNVQDKWLPRYDVTYVGKFIPSDDWNELRDLLVHGALDRLCERLIAMCPIMVKTDYVKPTEEALLRILEVEKKNLEGYLSSFHVKRIDGIPTIAEEYGN